MIFNIYNEKFQDEDQKYPVEQKLTTMDISEKANLCEDFNAHHDNIRKYQNSICAIELISWINRFNCKLINISNKMTYKSHLGISQSVLDSTFATSKIAENIVD